MKNGEMKTLREWMKELKITPVKYTFESTGNTIDTYKSEVKKTATGTLTFTQKAVTVCHIKTLENILMKYSLFKTPIYTTQN